MKKSRTHRVVEWPRASVQVRVCSQPGPGSPGARDLVPNSDDFGHLKPAEQPVYRRAAINVPPRAVSRQFHTTEGAEEQEQVARADTLSSEVALGTVDLSERRSPVWQTCQCGDLKVGIEVTPVVSLHPAPSQAFHERTE